LFTSYAPLANPKLASRGESRVALTRIITPPGSCCRPDISRPAVRFGTPTNLQIASTPDDEEKEVGTEEGDDMIADQNGH